MGVSFLFSVNLAFHDINDDSIKVYPKDSGSKKEKIISACKEFQNEGINIIIGPIDSTFTNELKRFDDLVFLSLSNMNSSIEKNIMMMGINLESQLLAIKNFIEKKNKKKTIILYPDNNKSRHIEKKIKELALSNSKIFKYSNDSEILTGQIEKLTNYKQRKINLESRVKILEKSELPKDIRELNQLKQKYTLGKVNFDSVVIIDFDDGLKSVLTSLAYTDVSEKELSGTNDADPILDGLRVGADGLGDAGFLSEKALLGINAAAPISLIFSCLYMFVYASAKE